MQLDRAWEVMSSIPDTAERLAPLLALMRHALKIASEDFDMHEHLCRQLREDRPDFTEANVNDLADAILVLARNEKSTLS